MSQQFRLATKSEIPQIWTILQQAIARRKADASKQWQDGYPNPQVIESDIEKGVGYVFIEDGKIIGYSAVLVNDEPAYADIEGKWLTNDDFLVVHRVAISDEYLGKGYAKKILKSIEELALSKNINSIKADTNFDNPAMMGIFESLGYVYCGEVYFRGNSRRAYEKEI